MQSSQIQQYQERISDLESQVHRLGLSNRDFIALANNAQDMAINSENRVYLTERRSQEQERQFYEHLASKYSYTFDAKKPYESAAQKAFFSQVRRVEDDYARKLRAVGRAIGFYIRGLFPGGVPSSSDSMSQLLHAMDHYSDILRPWAEAAVNQMLASVSRRDLTVWRRLGTQMGRALHKEVLETSVGDVFRQRLADQVALITSLPTDAAQRVHRLVQGAMYRGDRADVISAEILRTEDVTKSRADLIAKTEVGKASSELTRARALKVGSPGYVWRSARDKRVRRMHKILEGTYHDWDDLPIAEESGERHLPGCFPNCRCYCEVIIPGLH